MGFKKFCCFCLAFLLALTSVSCSEPENYILDDLSGFVYDGEVYVEIDLSSRRVQASRKAFEEAESIGKISERGVQLWKATCSPQKFNMEIPLFYAGGDLYEYYCPASMHDDFWRYIDTLTWTEEVVYTAYKKDDFVYSDPLSTFFLDRLAFTNETITIPYERNGDLVEIYRYDSTGLFMKEIAIIWRRPNGDCYVFYDVNFDSSKEDTLSDEDYSRFYKAFEEQKIPSQFIEEISKSLAY